MVVTVSSSSGLQLTQKELADYMKGFEAKMAAYMDPPAQLTEEEAKKFGLKDADE
jgi:hypothetical protein